MKTTLLYLEKSASFLSRASQLTLLVLLFSGGVFGQSTITITQSSSGITAAGYDSGAERTWTQDGVSFGAKAVSKENSQSRLQMQASNGVFYNTIALPGKILSVVISQATNTNVSSFYGGTTSRLVNATTGNYTVTGGTVVGSPSYTGWTASDFTSTDYTYFAIKRGPGAAYWTSIVITYQDAPTSDPALAITGTTTHGSTCPIIAATSQTYTITNSGTLAATGISVVSNDAQFVVSGLSSTSIAASGGTATYTVTFTPTSSGAKTATITVASTTTGSNSPTSSLTGTGNTPVTASVTTGAASAIGTTTATLGASASTFGVCPATTIKGIVYSLTSTNAIPTVGGSGSVNQTVTLGSTGSYTSPITGLNSSSNYSYRAYLYDGITYTYGSVVTFNTLAPLANDLCADAIELTVNATLTNGTLASSTFTSPFTEKDVWYKFTPTCNGSHIIIVTDFSGDVDIYLFNQSSLCPTTTAVVGTSAGSSATETITATLTSGVTYYVRVKAYNAAAEAPFTIKVIGDVPGTASTITPTGGATTCVGVDKTYTATAVTNATSYTWSFPSGWVVSVPSTTNVITVTPSVTAGNVSVTANNCYGSGVAKTLNVTPSSIPATPGTVSGNATICGATVNTYSVVAVPGATSYTWTLPGSWTGTSTTTSINATANGGSGNITVTANNACGSSAAQTLAVTVNPLPATPGIPTSNSPQCAPAGVTLTRTGSVPVGETWFWQTTASGTSEVNSGATFNAATSGTYYIRSKNTTTGCWSASASLTVVVNSTISTLATVPSPTNNNTTVCYSGTGATSSLSWTAAAGATSYDVYFGSGSMPGTVTANVATVSYTVGTLLPSTTYYWKVVPRNGCGVSTGTVVNWSFTTQAGICYCPSNPSSNDNSGISNVVMGSANFAVSDVTYYNYTGSVPNLTQGASIASSITFATGFSYHNHIWIDFNDDGIFNNTNEKVFSGESLAANPTTYSTTFTLGGSSAVGLHKMRIGTADSGQSTPNPCYSGSFGVTIDLMVNIIPSCTPTHTITSFSPTSGPVGTVVTVIGTGFAGTTAVLGAVTATVSDLSSTQFKVTIPSGAITSDLVLTDNVSSSKNHSKFLSKPNFEVNIPHFPNNNSVF